MSIRTLKALLWIAIGGLALFRAWDWRYELVNDTVSYLDMGDQFFAGNFSAIVNGTWGPLYALLLGAWTHLLRPAPRWEYPAIHALLFLLYLGCMACFDLFLAELIRFKERLDAKSPESEKAIVPAAALIVIGYTIFAWATLALIGVEETNPDMLVATFFFLASAAVLRIHNSNARTSAIVLLGTAVAGGYLTKAAFVPVGGLLILSAAMGAGGALACLRIGLIASLTACLLAAPQVIALSSQRGRLTASETGRFNYAVHVQGVTYRHWQGETPGAGRPVHPTRKLLDAPAVFEFDGPLPGTYPFWFDPSYWYEGLMARADWRRQAGAIATNGPAVLYHLFSINCAPLCLLILLHGIAIRYRGALASAAKSWIVMVPAAAGVVPYVLVHYESRYVAGFLCVLLTAGIASARVPTNMLSAQLYSAAAALIVAMFAMPFPTSPVKELGVYRALRGAMPDRQNTNWSVAAALHEAGYGPGTKVATIEYANMSSVLWARLARMKVIAEVYYRPDRPETHPNLFWRAPAEARRRVLDALRSAGARVAVTAETPRGWGAGHWRRLADSQYHYIAL